MSKKHVLFFDDYPMQSENKLFLERLRAELQGMGVKVLVEKTTRGVENVLSTKMCAVVVLDIMAEVHQDFRAIDGSRVPSTLAGIEVLSRCRRGNYLVENASVPIFMRTTRGEGYIRRECLDLGASGYFLVGKEDKRLVRRICSVVSEDGEPWEE